MKKACRTGSAEGAVAMQKQNGVAADFAGPWYHGSGKRGLWILDNRHAKFTWLTRSPAGGISWGPNVLTIYIIAPLDEPHLTDAGAGDDGGTNPYDVNKKLPNWWLKVNTAEIDKLMVVQYFEPVSTSGDDLKATLKDVFYVNLQKEMTKIGSK